MAASLRSRVRSRGMVLVPVSFLMAALLIVGPTGCSTATTSTTSTQGAQTTTATTGTSVGHVDIQADPNSPAQEALNAVYSSVVNLTISASAGGRSGQGVGSGIFHSLSPHAWHVLVGIELDPSQPLQLVRRKEARPGDQINSQSCGELLRSHGSPGLIQGLPGRDHEEIVGPCSRVCAQLNGSRNVHAPSWNNPATALDRLS